MGQKDLTNNKLHSLILQYTFTLIKRTGHLIHLFKVILANTIYDNKKNIQNKQYHTSLLTCPNIKSGIGSLKKPTFVLPKNLAVEYYNQRWLRRLSEINNEDKI